MKKVKAITRSHWFTTTLLAIVLAAALYGVWTFDAPNWVRLIGGLVVALSASQVIGNYREAIGKYR